MLFLLRLTKNEVLENLPPKIIQDRYCDLSPSRFMKISHTQAKQKKDFILVRTYSVSKQAGRSTAAGGDGNDAAASVGVNKGLHAMLYDLQE
uniref:Uncharacterized protein n=1 Tax=Physcomitrium patens TaxID=3218 RepID=A0A7I4AG76_PHYPA